jgi:hypothetical protein
MSRENGISMVLFLIGFGIQSICAMDGLAENVDLESSTMLYEIGQTTVSPGTYNIIQGMSAIEKGSYLVKAAGGSYVQAAFGAAWGQVGATVGTGLTPSGYLLGLGAFEAVDYQTRK